MKRLDFQGVGKGSWTDLTRAEMDSYLTLNQRVVGSSPTAPTSKSKWFEPWTRNPFLCR